MRAVMADKARLQRMLDVERALAARRGVARRHPKKAAASRSAMPAVAEHYDIAALGEAAVASGNIAIPLVKALTARSQGDATPKPPATCIGARPARTSSTPRWCSTCARPSTSSQKELDRAIAAFSKIAINIARRRRVGAHMAAAGLPMPFGLKAAGYAAALARSRGGCMRLRDEALVLQFGGAAGTLAALGERGFEVVRRLANELELPLPGSALAQPSRPAGRSRQRIRDPCRHLRKDRARCLAADADRDRRSVRARRAPAVAAPPPCRTSEIRSPARSALACAQIAPHLARLDPRRRDPGA